MLSINSMSNQPHSLSFQGGKDSTSKKVLNCVKTKMTKTSLSKKEAKLIDMSNLNALLIKYKDSPEGKNAILRRYVEEKLATMSVFEKTKLFLKTIFTKTNRFVK